MSFISTPHSLSTLGFHSKDDVKLPDVPYPLERASSAGTHSHKTWPVDSDTQHFGTTIPSLYLSRNNVFDHNIRTTSTHHFDPSNSISYAVPPNTPIPQDNLDAAFPFAEVCCDRRLHAPSNFAFNGHVYASPDYPQHPQQLQDEPAPPPGREVGYPSARYPDEEEHWLPFVPEIKRTHTSTAGTCTLPSNPPAPRSLLPLHSATPQQPKAFSNSSGIQGFLVPEIPFMPNYGIAPTHQVQGTAPFNAFSVAPSIGNPSVPLQQPINTAQYIGSQGAPTSRPAHRCCWTGTPCQASLSGDKKELRDHLKHGHHFRATGKKYHRCLWSGCTQVLQRENIIRHIISRHLRIKVRCSACGIELARSDVQFTHWERCPARI
ncbi:hypothetical protein HYDPIDRAFT_25928 [Hydnomerulius pinastri MD-312]|nr:hypothetical protein HYDPIDRAFT_25928 [Hydnomerulius pinastri MD-312]